MNTLDHVGTNSFNRKMDLFLYIIFVNLKENLLVTLNMETRLVKTEKHIQQKCVATVPRTYVNADVLTHTMEL